MRSVSLLQICYIIKQHPPILCYDVETHLRPWIEYMIGLGVEDVGGLILNRPSVVGLKVTESLQKIVRYLTE